MTRFNLAALCLVSVVFAQEEPKEPAETKPDAKARDTESGLKYWVVKAAEKPGARAKRGDTASFHFRGSLEGGKEFMASQPDKPLEMIVGVGRVFPGWDEALQLVEEGSTVKFLVPWKLAFGAQGRGAVPPRTDILLEITMLEVTKGEPLPEYRPLDAAKEKKTESGIRYEMTREGEGAAPTPAQGVKLKFALWNGEGKLVMCTQVAKRHITGPVPAVKLANVQEKFMTEAARLLKPGGAALFVVPPELCWGKMAVHPDLPADSTTTWLFELVKVFDLPPFVNTPADKLTKTASGLMYEVVKEGTGNQPTAADSVTVHYTGWTPDGNAFDSSIPREEPTTFPLRNVIKGWTEGVQLMKEGAVYRFTIPGRLAYGETPERPGTPAGTLIFVIELLKVKSSDASGR